MIITPNIPEAEVLTNIKINNIEDMILASTRLLNLGAKNILLKGGHLNSKILRDLFFNNKEYKVFFEQKKSIQTILMAQVVLCQAQLQLFYLVENPLINHVS